VRCEIGYRVFERSLYFISHTLSFFLTSNFKLQALPAFATFPVWALTLFVVGEYLKMSLQIEGVLMTFPLPKLGRDGSTDLEPTITGLEPTITGLEPTITGLEPAITGLEGLLVRLAREYPKGLPGKLRKTEMESLIVKLCSDGFVRLQDLAKALNRSKAFLSEDYLKPMVSKASLMLRHPDKLKHPEQAYCSRRTDS
jgi:hypothetical protein